MSQPIRITLARKKTELKQILALQAANLDTAVGAEVAQQQGFLTAVHTPETLAAINDATAAVIAKEGTRVVGYALAMRREFAQDVPTLTELFTAQDNALWQGQRAADIGYLAMGQICVAATARGQRIPDRMYRYLRSCYHLHYPLLLTAVNVKNTRSLRVHERVGFRVVDRFLSPTTGKEWAIVLWDWRA